MDENKPEDVGRHLLTGYARITNKQKKISDPVNVSGRDDRGKIITGIILPAERYAPTRPTGENDVYIA